MRHIVQPAVRRIRQAAQQLLFAHSGLERIRLISITGPVLERRKHFDMMAEQLRFGRIQAMVSVRLISALLGTRHVQRLFLGECTRYSGPGTPGGCIQSSTRRHSSQ